MLLLTFSSDNRFSPQSNFISLRFREISRVVNELWEHDNHSKFSKYSMPDKDEMSIPSHCIPLMSSVLNVAPNAL